MSGKAEFVHLHNHSEYSMLDGITRLTAPGGKGPSDLLKSLSKDGAKALALTDHGNMYGAIEFYEQCTKLGIKPIIGCEMYLAKGSRLERTGKRKEVNCHLTVLARNFEGYQNLMTLVSLGFTEGYYYDPRIDRQLLSRHSKGLIVLSGCLNSELSKEALSGNLSSAERMAVEYRDSLEPGAFFLEIMDHGIPDQRRVLDCLMEINKRTDIPLAATNDCHYARKSDADAHFARICISTGKKLDEPNDLKPEGAEFYFKTPEQMSEIFSFAPDAVKNTVKIAEMCALKIPMGQMLLPQFDVPAGNTQDSYLEELCVKGLRDRFGGDFPPTHKERLGYELGVIKRLGFSGYFLVVWDFIAYARSQNIPVGPGRGSGAGSLVAFALRITNIDPIPHNLLFERFLNPDRGSMPDLDIDFADTGRERVIEYVRDKYGSKNVAQIITFGSMAARLVVRDVGRVMGFSIAEVDKLAKSIPAIPGTTLYEAMTKVPELIQAATDPRVKKLLDLSLKLEGIKRHTGVHAAGTVITKEPVLSYTPLARSGRSEVVTTQYDGDALPRLGLLKVDFLGLRTLTIIDNAVKSIRARGRPDFDVDKLPMDDAKTFELLRSGKTLAVFQLDSQGIRDLVVRIKPTDFNDIVSLIALFRPGPMQAGMLDLFVNRKHGRERVKYDHALMEPILKDSYGCIVFQEQVMELSKKLANFTPGEADGLRKAMGKKIPEELEKMREQFVKGSGANKIAPKTANKVFDQMVKFGGYGFNKCLAGSARVLDAATGLNWTIGGLAATGRGIAAWSLDGKLQGSRHSATQAWSNGVKPVFRLRTILGKEITATDNHPFFTFGGWKNLGELKAGDRIASPRRLPAGTESWPTERAALLGWVLSEGNVCHPAGFYLYSTDAVQAADMQACAKSFDNTATTVRVRRGLNEIYVRAADSGDGRFKKKQEPWNKRFLAGGPAAASKSGARVWLESLGLIDKSATQKSVPAPVFGLNEESLAVLFGRLWSGDGFVFTDRNRLPFYSTSSKELARDVQDLLLRLGIVGRIHAKKFRYRGGHNTGYCVVLIGRTSLELFARRIGPHLVGKDAALAALRAHINAIPDDLTSKDTLPVEVRALVRREKDASGLQWMAVEAATGVCIKDFRGKDAIGMDAVACKRGFRRRTIRAMAEHFNSVELRLWSEAEIFWDTIESITPAGEEETFDLEVPGAHNFTADGLFVHNSHSAAYGLVAYHTAYLKANYPLEFMAAVATSEIGHSAVGSEDKENKMVTYLQEARAMGIKILPPDIQASRAEFSIEEGNAIRFGLVAVKNVGSGAVDSILKARADGPFKDLNDFCARIDLHAANKKTLESLIHAGALDSLEAGAPIYEARARLLSRLEGAVAGQARIKEDLGRGQGLLFGAQDLAAPPKESDPASAPAALSEHDVLKLEKEVLGFYFSGHPLLKVKRELRLAATHDIGSLNAQITTPVRLAGIMNQVKRMVTKEKGEQWARCTLEDLSGEINMLVFPRTYSNGVADELRVGRLVMVSGRLSFGRSGAAAEGGEGVPELVVDSVAGLETAVARFAGKLRLTCKAAALEPEVLERLRLALEAHRGRVPVVLEQDCPEGLAVLEIQQRVIVSQNLLDSVEKILGEDSWRIESAS